MAQVVMLHGWGMNQGIWQLQKEALEACSAIPIQHLITGYGGNKFMGSITQLMQ